MVTLFPHFRNPPVYGSSDLRGALISVIKQASFLVLLRGLLLRVFFLCMHMECFVGSFVGKLLLLSPFSRIFTFLC